MGPIYDPLVPMLAVREENGARTAHRVMSSARVAEADLGRGWVGFSGLEACVSVDQFNVRAARPMINRRGVKIQWPVSTSVPDTLVGADATNSCTTAC